MTCICIGDNLTASLNSEGLQSFAMPSGEARAIYDVQHRLGHINMECRYFTYTVLVRKKRQQQSSLMYILFIKA